MKQSQSWEANRSSTIRKIPRIMWKPEVLCHIHLYVYMQGNWMHREITAYLSWCMLMLLSWSWMNVACCMSKCYLLFFFTYSWRNWVQSWVSEGCTSDTLGPLSMHLMYSVILVVVDSCCSRSPSSLFLLCLFVTLIVTCELFYFCCLPLTVYPGVLTVFSE
jgi:hypothetical protein